MVFVAAIFLVAGVGSRAYAQLTAPSVSTGTYTVSWTATSGGQQRAYLLTDSGRINVTGTQSRTFTKPPGTYTYRLQLCFFEPSLNRELCDPPSPEVTVVVTTAAVPGTPGNLAGTPAQSTGAFTLSWTTAPGVVDLYEVEERAGATGSWSVTARPAAPPLSLNRANGSYFYRARACRAALCGGYSNTIEVTVRRIPSMPGSLGPDETLASSYYIRWGPASGVSRYELIEHADSTGRQITYVTTATSYYFHNRQEDTYRYRVRACNDMGCSLFTASKAVKITRLSNLEILGAESIPRDKASSFLCGNRNKPTPGPGSCSHRTPHGGEAFEVVEVRGWISWVAPNSNNRDPDYHYDIRLDPDNPPRVLSGPRAGETIPLSLILHPGNVIEAAETDRLRQFRHPENDRVFVGNNLKIEIHGWDRRRWGPVPRDWVAADDLDGDSNIFWPFHPRRPLNFQAVEIREGQYVRMVGTLWEDDPHNFGRCWDDENEGGHGWYELHPVDFMAMFDEFAPNPPSSTAQVIAACNAGMVNIDLRPPSPQPTGMVARFEEVIRVNENTTRYVTTHSDHITVHLDVGDRFWAYYRVYWGNPLQPPATPPRCPIGQKCCEVLNGRCSQCVPTNSSCP
jgi:hypothetical protein